MTDRTACNEISRLYLPEKIVYYITEKLDTLNIKLIISKPRLTKLGDYKPPVIKEYHRISVNRDLNKYSFLITLLHEIAHALVWNKYKGRVKPHSQEWKSEFRELLEEVLAYRVFPRDIESAIHKYFLISGNFSKSSYDKLNEVLRGHTQGVTYLRIMDIPENCTFKLRGGREFVKMKRIRKRYRCKDVGNGRLYTVSPYTEVISYY